MGFVLLDLKFYVQCFVDRCSFFCLFAFGHCVFCSFSTYGFLLPPFGIFKLVLLYNSSLRRDSPLTGFLAICRWSIVLSGKPLYFFSCLMFILSIHFGIFIYVVANLDSIVAIS